MNGHGFKDRETVLTQALKLYLEENVTVQTFQLEKALKGRTSLGGPVWKVIK